MLPPVCVVSHPAELKGVANWSVIEVADAHAMQHVDGVCPHSTAGWVETTSSDYRDHGTKCGRNG